MNIMKNISFLLFIYLLLAGCGHSGYKKTNTGMAYDIIASGNGEFIKHGDLIKINLKFMMGDSVLESTYEHIPAYGRVDTSIKDQHNFTDILPMMRIGDSAIIVMSLDTLKKMGMLPPTEKFVPGATKKGYIKIISRFTNQETLRSDYSSEEVIELNKELAILEKYLKEKNITATKTPQGAFVQIIDQGTGPVADSGKQISILYHGTTLKGEVFDSTKDPAFNHPNQPFNFVLGRGEVIQGWDECLKYFKQGGKGKLYIPAMLAYKNQHPSEVIKPYTNLIFEIEVVKVQDPQKAESMISQMPVH